MSNTFSQIHIQCVFAVKYRQSLIEEPWKIELEKYITSIVQNGGHKMIAINSLPDHIHMFFGLRPSQSISDMMETVKGDTSKWINRKRLTRGKFNWQEGYGAFSYSRSQVPIVAQYVYDQQEHHKKISFLDEYRGLLKEFEIEFDDRYIFKVPI